MFRNQTIFGWHKEKTKFRIDKLTNDTLKLTLISTKDLEMLESLGINIKDQLVFIFKSGSCQDLYKSDSY